MLEDRTGTRSAGDSKTRCGISDKPSCELRSDNTVLYIVNGDIFASTSSCGRFQEKEKAEGKLDDVRRRLRDQKMENNSTQELLQKVQEDKRRLGNRISKLISNG